MSQDVNPLGKGIRTKHTDDAFLAGTFTGRMKSARWRQQQTIRLLIRKVEEMVLNDDHIQDNMEYPVEYQDLQVLTWHASQSVAGDHQRCIPAILMMRIYMMRWRMMSILLNKTHHPKAKVVQEHHLEELQKDEILQKAGIS